MNAGSLQQYLKNLPSGEACLILKNGNPDDLARVRASLNEHNLQVLREKEFAQPDGLTTLVVSMPPQSLHDLILELAAKGVGGEMIGYEADKTKQPGLDHL